MSRDYTIEAEQAQSDMADNGRQVTLRLPTTTHNTATGVVTETNSDTTIWAVFTTFNTNDIDGTLIQRADRKVLIAALDATPTKRHKIVDSDDKIWEIKDVETVQPGDLAILHKVQARGV